MKYKAITLDTGIFDHHGLILNSGILHSLTQFKEKIPVKFILSEITYREIHLHIQQLHMLKNLLTQCHDNHLLPPYLKKHINTIHNHILDTQEPGKNHLKTFLKETGVEIIPANLTSIDTLLKIHFSTVLSSEQNTLLNTAALLSLEKWAKDNQTKILAVSMNKEWSEYARNSEWIDVKDNLIKILEPLQTYTSEWKTLLHLFFLRLKNKQHPECLEKIYSTINKTLTNTIVPYTDSFCPSRRSGRITTTHCRAIHLANNQFSIIQTNHNKAIIKIDATIKVSMTAEFPSSMNESTEEILLDNIASAKTEFPGSINENISNNETEEILLGNITSAKTEFPGSINENISNNETEEILLGNITSAKNEVMNIKLLLTLGGNLFSSYDDTKIINVELIHNMTDPSFHFPIDPHSTSENHKKKSVQQDHSSNVSVKRAYAS